MLPAGENGRNLQTECFAACSPIALRLTWGSWSWMILPVPNLKFIYWTTTKIGDHQRRQHCFLPNCFEKSCNSIQTRFDILKHVSFLFTLYSEFSFQWTMCHKSYLEGKLTANRNLKLSQKKAIHHLQNMTCCNSKVLQHMNLRFRTGNIIHDPHVLRDNWTNWRQVVWRIRKEFLHSIHCIETALNVRPGWYLVRHFWWLKRCCFDIELFTWISWTCHHLLCYVTVPEPQQQSVGPGSVCHKVLARELRRAPYLGDTTSHPPVRVGLKCQCVHQGGQWLYSGLWG